MTNPTNDRTKEKIISQLNQGASDSSPIIESPSPIYLNPAAQVMSDALNKDADAYDRAMERVNKDQVSKVESPSGILDQLTIQEALTSSNISRIIKGIEFLHNRIIKDSSQITGLMIELSNLLPDCSGADYFLKEGLESLKQGVEILKDSETGEKKKGNKK